MARLFSLKHDFPNAWHKYKTLEDGESFQAKISIDQFPYIAQLGTIALNPDQFELYQINKENFKLKPVPFKEDEIILSKEILNQENREANIQIDVDLDKYEEYFLLVNFNLTY
ncbi:MAG TPA: hypothetical protein VK021_10935 [Flavobacteriaceae bacterium]|nr:hypothetical protein [Flavobacteriaceae bacterium]